MKEMKKRLAFVPALMMLMTACRMAGAETAVATQPTETTAIAQTAETGSEVFDSIELALPVPEMNGELPGTLTVPKGEGPFPAVVLIHGSGAIDRDETTGALKPFRDLAEGLAERGVAVYRFDKRTYVYPAETTADRQFTPADESIKDAVNAVQLLAQQEQIDPERIFILGHSQGGQMIPAIALASEKAPVKAFGFIMLASSPRHLAEGIRDEYNYLCSVMTEVPAELQLEKDYVFAELDKLEHLDEMGDDDTVLACYAPYWEWLAAYDILQDAAEITRPVLALQGEEDFQVTMEDFGIWKASFGEKENWTLISLPGLTHCFVPGEKTEGTAVYYREGTVAPEVLEAIAAFIKQHS